MTNFFRSYLWCVFAIIVHIDNNQAIMPECTFTGTSGFCAGMAGRFIRRDYNPNIRAFYIVNSDLTALSAEDFAPFQSLTTLHINNCTLPQPKGRSLLSDLKQLTTLQITHSNLSDDIRFMFVNNTAVSNLSLQGNKLTQISNDTFSDLTELDTIDVSNNDISKIDENAFVNLKNLKKLILTANKIGETFDPTFLSLSPGECAVCGDECPLDASSRCKLNEETYNLWRAFKQKNIVFLKNNPICDKLEDKSTDFKGKNATVPGCKLYEEKKCSAHKNERHAFFSKACDQDPNAVEATGGRNNDDNTNVMNSPPAMGDVMNSETLMGEGGPNSDPEGNEHEEPALRISPSNDADAAANLNSEEGGEQQTHTSDEEGDIDVRLSSELPNADASLPVQMRQGQIMIQDETIDWRSVGLGAIGGVATALVVLTGLVTYSHFRKKRTSGPDSHDAEAPSKMNNEIQVPGSEDVALLEVRTGEET